MGIKNLWTYIKGHKDSYRDIDLAEEARCKGATADRRAELWCDYGAVVRQLETALLKERHPKYCSYYGCDTRLLGQQMGAFIEGLRSIHIEPVFVSDGPPGADEKGFRAKLEEIKNRQLMRRSRSRKWEDEVKSPQRHPQHNIPNPQCYVVCNQVLREHEVRNLVAHCEADTVLMHGCKTSKLPLGILSSDTDIAVAELNCAFLPLDFFDHNDVLGFHRGDMNHTIHSLPCRYTNRQLLANCLKLHYDDMTMFAILLGNDYTRQYAYKIKKFKWQFNNKKLNDPQEVAQWLSRNRPYSGRIEEYKRRYEGFHNACEHSIEFYSGREANGIHPLNVSQLGTLSPTFLTIKKGIFLQPIVAEVRTVRGPLPYKVSQTIRKTIYALCDQAKVIEYGFRTFEAGDFGKNSVGSKANLRNFRPFLQRCPFSTRAAALHHLISTPLHYLAEIGHVVLRDDPPADLPPDEQEVLRGIIAVSTLVYLASDKEMRLEENEIQSCLLAFAATSAGVQGDVDVGQPDPDHFLRAVSLSSTISVSLLALYYVAELLDLAPKVSDIFCSSVFVPAYMAVMQHLPAGIPALAPVVDAVESPHTTELVKYIRIMGHTQGMHELTPPSILTEAVRSYTALVGEMRDLETRQHYCRSETILYSTISLVCRLSLIASCLLCFLFMN